VPQAERHTTALALRRDLYYMCNTENRGDRIMLENPVAKRAAIGAAIGAVIAIPLPFVGPILGGLVGGGIGYFTAARDQR
jgi:hypothetical protein